MTDKIFPMTRRSVLKGGATLGAASLIPTMLASYAQAENVSAEPSDIKPQMLPVQMTVNGKAQKLTLDSRTTLLDALRNHMRLTGSKKGCDHGQCGACTVLINERRINACLTLAVMHEGEDIRTIEGLGSPDDLHPMQAAFVEHDGFQCGYCTPGQICSAIGMLREAKAGMPSHVTEHLDQEFATLGEDEIRERMSGNLCRCAAYPNIVAAIKQAEDST
jgi:xanthine dehydrogenase YagT iron-sulfur-binding subunit